MKPLLLALALATVGCSGDALDLTKAIHIDPDETFLQACPSEDFCRGQVLAGLNEWLELLPASQRPQVIWRSRGASNNVRMRVRDYAGAAAAKFGWHGGDAVITFDDDGISEMIASHEFGHALLTGSDADHVPCDGTQDVMSDSLLCWAPVAAVDLLQVCHLHPEVDCAASP